MQNSSSLSPMTTKLLLLSDLIGLILCFNFAFGLRLKTSLNWQSPLLYGLILIYLAGLYLADAYRPDLRFSGLSSLIYVPISILVTVVIVTSLFYLTALWGDTPLAGRGILFFSIGSFMVWAMTSRIIALQWLRHKLSLSRWMVLVGEDHGGKYENRYQVLGPDTTVIYLTTANSDQDTLSEMSCSGTVDTVSNFSFWSDQYWSGILIDDTIKPLPNALAKQLMQMRLRGINIYSMESYYEHFLQKIPPAFIKDDWFAFTSGFRLFHNHLNLRIKRCADFVVASLVLVLIFPLLLPIALAIKLDSRGPIFYRQIRTGLEGDRFYLYKFRSMYEDAEQRGAQWARDHDPRITRVGRVLRTTRLDELPQLWNVLMGEMSLIGPRPERPEFDIKLEQEIPYYRIRYLVRPGITGWAQVMYSYGASIEDAYQKVAYDLYYIKNYSLLLDLVILLKTVRVVLLGKGR